MIISDMVGNTEDIKSLAIPLFTKRFFWLDFEDSDRTFTGTMDRYLIYHPFFVMNLDNCPLTPTLKTIIEHDYEEVVYDVPPRFSMNAPDSVAVVTKQSAKQQLEIYFRVREICTPKQENIVRCIAPVIITFEFLDIKSLELQN